MHVTERQHPLEGGFVLDPHAELASYLAQVICSDAVDTAAPYVYYPSEEGMTIEEAVCDKGPDADFLAITLADMTSCVERMTSRQRTVLYNTLAGWSAEEVGERLGISRGRVYAARSDAIAILRQHYRNGHS